jgi:hypothetical protein
MRLKQPATPQQEPAASVSNCGADAVPTHEARFLQGPQSRGFELGKALSIFYKLMRDFRTFQFLTPCVPVFASARLADDDPLAACQYFRGRRVGNRMNGCDGTSNYCQRRKKIMVEQLDHFDEPTSEVEQLVVEDIHSTPPEIAATRVDCRAWLKSLPERTRHVAETLTTGEATSHVARMFGFSASRVSQLRRERYDAWREFQGEVVPATSSALA